MAEVDPLVFEIIKNSFTSIPEEAAVALDGVDRAEDCIDRAASLAFVGQLHEVGVELEQTGIGLLQEGCDQCMILSSR